MNKPYNMIASSLISVTVSLGLTGCNSMLSSRMPKSSVSMAQAYQQAIDGIDDVNDVVDSDTLDHVREKVHALKQLTVPVGTNTNALVFALQRQFPRLPNSSIMMYVYPHEAGSGSNVVPVPGYSTVFPLYQHVNYAMPGEAIEK